MRILKLDKNLGENEEKWTFKNEKSMYTSCLSESLTVGVGDNYQDPNFNETI